MMQESIKKRTHSVTSTKKPLKKSHTSSILKKPSAGPVILVKKEQQPVKKMRAKSSVKQRNFETSKIYSSVPSNIQKRSKSGTIKIQKRKKSVISAGSKMSQNRSQSVRSRSAAFSAKSKSPKPVSKKSKSPKPSSKKSKSPAISSKSMSKSPSILVSPKSKQLNGQSR